MSLYVLSHITAWTQGQPLLPTFRNSGRFLTIPLGAIEATFILSVMNEGWAVVPPECFGMNSDNSTQLNFDTVRPFIGFSHNVNMCMI